MRMPGRRPHHVVLPQPGVHQRADRRGMTDRRDAADHLPRPGPHRPGIGPAHRGGADERRHPRRCPPGAHRSSSRAAARRRRRTRGCWRSRRPRNRAEPPRPPPSAPIPAAPAPRRARQVPQVRSRTARHPPPPRPEATVSRVRSINYPERIPLTPHPHGTSSRSGPPPARPAAAARTRSPPRTERRTPPRRAPRPPVAAACWWNSSMIAVPLNRTLPPRSHSGSAAPSSHAARAGDPVFCRQPAEHVERVRDPDDVAELLLPVQRLPEHGVAVGFPPGHLEQREAAHRVQVGGDPPLAAAQARAGPAPRRTPRRTPRAARRAGAGARAARAASARRPRRRTPAAGTAPRR